MRNKDLDVMRGIAILLVVIGHAIVLNGYAPKGSEPFLYEWIKLLQMPMFMMLSAYLAARSKVPASIKEWFATARKRGISYLVPFFVWMLVTHPKTFIPTLSTTLFDLDYGNGLWFLMVLFILTLQFTITRYLVEKWNKKALLLVLAPLFYVGLFILQRLGIRFLSPDMCLYYFPFYYLAYCFGMYQKEIAKKWLAIGGGIGSVSYILLCIRFDVIDVSNKVELLLQMGMACLGAVSLMALIKVIAGRKYIQPIAWIGCYTLEIYVLHFHFARWIPKQLKNGNLASVEGILGMGLSILVMAIATLLIAGLFGKVPVLNLLFFGKQPKTNKTL